MVHSISQEMFDATVRENMEEFGMNVDEAIEDTVKEYTAQGADLSKVIVDLMASNIDPKPVTEAVVKLSNFLKGEGKSENFIATLNEIKAECDKGLQYKVIAGKEGAYNVILDLLLREQKDVKVVTECFKTLSTLMNKQPDLLDAAGVQSMITFVDNQQDENVLKLLLKWVRECCILHEHNRQHIMEAGILDHLKPRMAKASSSLLCAILGVLRALVLDDDIRVEFGKAHEHARIIASDTLCAITALLEKFKTDENLMNELMLTLSALLVRTEFCKKVEDAGGLPIILDSMKNFVESDKLNRQCFKVLKALAGNDECKGRIIKSDAAPLIVSALTRHKDSVQTAIVGLGCITALTLRNAENSEALFKAGAPKIIITLMEIHTNSEPVQKNASWAIRNMVSRSRHQNQEFLKLGAEDLLKTALKKYKKSEYDIKAALRDLECNVDLKEEWTGKGGKLHTDEKSPRK